jgi:hypothetical protein
MRRLDGFPLFGRALRGGVTLAVGLVLLLSGTAQAAATVTPISFQVTYGPDPITLDNTSCGVVGNPVGYISGTETRIGQITDSGQGLQVHSTDTNVVRLDMPFANPYGAGAYVLATTITRVAYTQHGSVWTFTNVVQDQGDVIYSPTGVPIGPATFHLVEHFTTLDLGAPGPSPEDQFIVDKLSFRFTCP